MAIDLPVIEGGKEIGTINVDTGEITVNSDLPIRWDCCMDGDCCQRFMIPITDFDIKRIESHDYALDQIIADEAPFIRMPKNRFGSVEKNYPIKRKPFDNSCTFLEPDGKCGIHPFRPFSCRIYPFQFRFDNESVARVTIHETVCHQVEGVAAEKAQNEEFLRYLLQELRRELEIREEYFSTYGDQI